MLYSTGCGAVCMIPKTFYCRDSLHVELFSDYYSPSVWVGSSVASVCLSVYPFVRAVKAKRLKLSTPNSYTHIFYSSRSACIDSEVKMSKVEGHTVTKTVTVARLLMTRAAMVLCCCCRRGSACRYDCLFFSLYVHSG